MNLQTVTRTGRSTHNITNVSDGGHGGFYVYHIGKKVGVLIADGERFWSVEKNLPAVVEPDEWFNLAFRWSLVRGVQVSS